MIQALPVLRLIKLHHPQSEIYWWVELGLAGLLEGDPDLAGVIPFDRHGWAAPRNWGAVWRSVRWMRAQRFDWVIDLQCLARSGAFAWLANGELTVGLDEVREGARGYYDLIAPRPTYYTHAVDWYLGVLRLLGVPADRPFEWIPKRPAAAKAVREKWPLAQHRWITLQPGARWVNKRWPVESFAQTVRLLRERDPSLRFAVLGGREDSPLGETIARAGGDRCLDLIGKLTLPEMIEWIRATDLMVSNDTGPMHVAAALRKPVVGLFGPTEPRRTGPYGQVDQVLQHPLSCVPCMKSRCRHSPHMECLTAIDPAAVARQVLARLHATEPVGTV